MNVEMTNLFSIASAKDSSISEILELNEMIAASIFSAEKSGVPVHLDMEDESISGIPDFNQRVINAVVKLHKSEDPLKIFSEFVYVTKRWTNSGDLLSTPPALSLLAVLSMAADAMVASDNISANNYYSRLSDLLEKSGSKVSNVQQLASNYRACAVELWTSLIDWLNAWQGDRGIPTVPLPGQTGDADSRKYIRMPISQALLRESDRQNLYKMFTANNLDPAMNMSVELMKVVIDQWITSPYRTDQLKKIWKEDDYKESLVLLTIALLESWPGSETESQSESGGIVTSTSSKVGLTLVLDNWTRRADFGMEVRYSGLVPPKNLGIRIADNSYVVADTFLAGPKTVRIGDLSFLETGSILEGVFDVKDETIGLKGQRRPRAITPMIYRSSTGEYVEVSAITMGSTHGILVKDVQEIGLREKVIGLLSDVARPGWEELDTSKFSGFPEGWFLFQNVDIVVPFDVQSVAHKSLEILVPLETSSVQLSNGFRIPGRRERWLRTAAPEIFALVPRSTTVKIEIYNSADVLVASTPASPRAAILELRDYSLPSGAYRAKITTDDGEIINTSFALVDGNTPNPSAQRLTHTLGYQLTANDGFSNLSAQSITEAKPGEILRGLHHELLLPKDGHVETQHVPTDKPWRSRHEAERIIQHTKARVAPAERQACVSHGSHTMLLPTWYGKPKSGFIEGVCKYCGLARKYPARGVLRKELKKSQTKKVNEAVPISQLAPLVKTMPPITVKEFGAWDDVLEAMCYLRHGTFTELEAIASRLSAGRVGVDRLVRYLSALGHIDIEMNERIRPERWCVSPAVVVRTGSHQAHLAGFRSAEFIDEIMKTVTHLGGEVGFIQNSHAPTLVSIRIPREFDLKEVLSGVVDPIAQQQIAISENTCRTLLSNCAPISIIVSDSPKISRPHYSQVNRWNPETASWSETDSNLSQGAFQNIGHGYSYTFNDSQIGLGDLTTSGTSSTVKHNTSRIGGVPLHFYSPESKVLVTRLGAELPPIMNRAIVALTGRLPEEDESNSLVKYHDIPQDIANSVHYLLTN